MPITQPLPPLQGSTTPLQEPISLEELRGWVNMEAGDAIQDANLTLAGKGARQMVESYTNDFYIGGQRLETTFDLSERFALPQGVVVEDVSGFFTSLEELQNWSLEEYRKGISINRQLYWMEAINQTYTVTYSLPLQAHCPDIVKLVMLRLAADFFRNREDSVVGTIISDLPVNYRVMLAPYRKNPIL